MKKNKDKFKAKIDFYLEPTIKVGSETQHFTLDDVPTTPNPEQDYIRVPFRLISATVVGAGSWKASDFSDVEILRAATDKLLNVPVYTDHYAYTGEAIGIVEQVAFVEQTNDADGNIIPAGINGVLRIDVQAHPKIARDLQSDPPLIRSNSVTVSFLWTPSHEGDDYRWRIGEISTVDGKMISRKVVEILEFYETSLVFLGADPYAKILDENGLPRFVHQSDVFNQPQTPAATPTEPEAPAAPIADEVEVSNSKPKVVAVSNQQPKELEVFSFAAETSKITALLEKEKKDLTAKLSVLQQEFIALNDKYNQSVDKLTKYLAGKREQCKKLYLVSVQGKNLDTAPMLALIENASEDVLATLLQQYGADLFDNFSITCACGKAVDYQTSSTQTQVQPENKPNPAQKNFGKMRIKN